MHYVHIFVVNLYTHAYVCSYICMYVYIMYANVRMYMYSMELNDFDVIHGTCFFSSSQILVIWSDSTGAPKESVVIANSKRGASISDCCSPGPPTAMTCQLLFSYCVPNGTYGRIAHAFTLQAPPLGITEPAIMA